jgi:hypothetical protein
LPSTTVQPIQTTTNPYVISPPTPINISYDQSTENLPVIPNTSFTVPTLPIDPSITLPS